MTGPPHAFVHEAELVMDGEADERAPGGAITVALCGHWEHEGSCRWPHNNAIALEGRWARLRTVFVAPPEDEETVRERIERGLRSGADWEVVSVGARPLAPDEEELAERLTRAL